MYVSAEWTTEGQLMHISPFIACKAYRMIFVGNAVDQSARGFLCCCLVFHYLKYQLHGSTLSLLLGRFLVR